MAVSASASARSSPDCKAGRRRIQAVLEGHCELPSPLGVAEDQPRGKSIDDRSKGRVTVECDRLIAWKYRYVLVIS